MDVIDLSIVRELRRDARMSVAELARRVSLSRPSVAERVRRLEDTGIITGYGAHLNLAKIGLGLQARISLKPVQRLKKGPEQLRATFAELGCVLSCVHVTGENCYEIAVAVRDAEHLENVIDALSAFGDTTTAIVLSEVLVQQDFVP